MNSNTEGSYMRLFKFSLLILFLTLSLGTAQTASAALCKVGDSPQVKWGGKWWPATVIAVNSAGTQCKIHYKGYGGKWDEWVGASRIRAGGKRSASSAKTSSSGYYVGQRVKVLWGNKWWNAKILDKKGKRYYIKYDGYGSEWNEWVGTSRMRLR